MAASLSDLRKGRGGGEGRTNISVKREVITHALNRSQVRKAQMEEGRDDASPFQHTHSPCAVLLQPDEDPCFLSLLLYFSVGQGA